MRIKRIEINERNLKKPNLKLIDKSIKNVKGIYFLYDQHLNLIYIGQTKTLRLRLLQHISPRVDRSCLGFGRITKIPLGEVYYYSFIEVKDDSERTLRELILMNLLKPKYNYKFIHKHDKKYNN